MEQTKLSLLSIIMPAYNAENYIADTISSILNQDYQNFELLIYNDSSTDRTLEIVLSFNDSRICLFNGERNVGAANSRNILLSKAKGKYIAFFDSDDICQKNKFSFCISYLERKKDVDLVGSKILYIDEKSRPYYFIKSFESFLYNDTRADLFFNNTFSTSTIVFKSRILKMFEFNQKFEPAEDYELFARISRQIKMENVNKKLVKYRISSQSLSFSKKERVKGTLDFIHRRFFLECFKMQIDDESLLVHNKFLYENQIELKYLEDSIRLYEIIIEKNAYHIFYNEKSLMNAIRKNWFLKCLYSLKTNGTSSIRYYISKFPYHNITSFYYLCYLILGILKHHIMSFVKYFIK